MADEINPDKHFQTIVSQRPNILIDMPDPDAFL
jgi:hypothetical protein